jgi:hypothetical protein
MNRAALRRALAALVIVAVVFGSVTAQAVETRLAGHVVSTTSAPAAPQHVCAATRCRITARHHRPGRWPGPILPAVLLAAGALGGLGYMRLKARNDAAASAPTNTERGAEAPNRPTNQSRLPQSPTRSVLRFSRDAQKMYSVMRRIKAEAVLTGVVDVDSLAEPYVQRSPSFRLPVTPRVIAARCPERACSADHVP